MKTPQTAPDDDARRADARLLSAATDDCSRAGRAAILAYRAATRDRAMPLPKRTIADRVPFTLTERADSAIAL